MLDKSSLDRELARRLCAAFVSHQLGVTVATQYKNTPDDVGDLWYFLAALAKELARESQNSLYGDLGSLATTIIQ
jgi:hypothetical protein